MKLLGVSTFGFLEQFPDQMLEHIERLIRQCRREIERQRGERGVATQRLKLRQVLHSRGRVDLMQGAHRHWQ